MRATVIALILALLITVFVVNRYRDAIALEVANRALGDNDMIVTDVSVESIRADYVRFDEIVLELASGTVVRIEGVSLPVKFLGFAGSTLQIERVTAVTSDADNSPPRLAESLRAFLDAPAAMPGGTVTVDTLIVTGLPEVHDLTWDADILNPTLRASIGLFDVFLTITPATGDMRRASLRVLSQDDTEAVLLGFHVQEQAPGYGLQGRLTLRLEPLLPIFHALEAIPGEISGLRATVGGTFETRVTDALPISVSVLLDPISALEADYGAGDDTPVHLSITQSGSVGATIEYPSLAWSAATDGAVVLLDAGPLDSLPITLQNPRCQSGLQCDTGVELSLDSMNVGALSIGGVSVSAKSVQLTSLDGNLQATSADATVRLQSPAVAGRPFLAPGIVAEVEASSDQLLATLHLSTPEGGFSGRARLRHDLSRETGVMRFEDTALDFDILNLSEVVADWPYDLDVASGHWRIGAEINWAVSNEGFAYTGSTVHSLDSLAGSYGDIGFVGLDSEVEVTLDWQAEPSLSPAAFDVALIDVGFPIRDMHGRFKADINSLAADVDSVSMAVLGGNVSIDPFRYEHTADTNELMLKAKGIQLPLMVGLADLEAVQISGSVSGDIPVTIKNGNIIINKGLLENDPPGGTIRYGADEGIVDEGSQLGIVSRTLRNFEFDVLTSEVDYTDSGDLKLQMRLTGTNPDVDPNQPVILNLAIENNVPQMLRSLQATRSIEDVLEQRLAN
jgi:hypothetical protein